MAKNLEQIFEECLERMFQGESIESCLMSYPNEAASLEPLLRTVLGVSNRAATLQPDPEFKARARMRIDSAWHYTAQQKPVQKTGGFSWQRSWAFALSAIVLLLFGSVGTAFASSDALPDETLYGAKLATEQVKLAFTFAEEDKAALHTELAEKRAAEIAVMAKEGKTDYVVATATKMSYQMEQAEFAIQKLEMKESAQLASIAVTSQPAPSIVEPRAPQPAPALMPSEIKLTEDTISGAAVPEITPEPSDETGKTRSEKVERVRKLVQQSASKNLSVLEGVLEDAPEQAKPALEQVINRTKEVQERTLQKPVDLKPERPDKSQKDKPDVNTEDQQPVSEEQKPIRLKPRPIEPQKPQTDEKLVYPQKTPEHIEIPKPISDTIQPSDTTNIRPSTTPVPVVPQKIEDTIRKPENTTDRLNNITGIKSNEGTSIITSTTITLEIDRSINTSFSDNITKQ